ncbi:isochorismatase family protein, partial [Mesorhizobium sp. M2A.F.Ca.ET.042.01.1.1]|uniref:isochorismatase family protein n=1 Tax=Mesorhizobium sp. M2A.F.Ca.ET.042.01.1.1 TaxID=2496745 RepID=UPI000FCB180E
IENLVVAGVLTDSCVTASVFDAVYHGFRVWLVKDACGSMTEAMHRTGMLDMANRLYGGGILRQPEALKALAGQTFDGWRCTRPVEFAYTLETVDGIYEAL